MPRVRYEWNTNNSIRYLEIQKKFGAKIKCMLDHIKLVIRDKADHIIFHVGTNDIPSDKYARDIAK